MKNELKTNDLLRPLKIGEIIEGQIIGIDRSSVFVDLGPQGTGIIYGQEFYEAKENLKGLKIGDKIFAKIVELENEDGYIELSLKAAGKELAWEFLKQKKEKGESLTVKILGANKGGLLAKVSDIQAFLPVSQLSSEHYPRVEDGDPIKILKELQKFTGKELEVKIFDLNPEEEKLILSERLLTAEKIKEILKNYKVGDIVDGEITGIVDFGAFVKFGKEQLEGLIHISELDWQLIENPAEIVKVNQKVKAKIIEIVNNQVSLSLKALKENPWLNIEEKYKKGDIIKGKVTKFTPFGTFVQITPEIQGLCHISEFGSQKKMQETLEIGKEYDFQILQINSGAHKIILKVFII